MSDEAKNTESQGLTGAASTPTQTPAAEKAAEAPAKEDTKAAPKAEAKKAPAPAPAPKAAPAPASNDEDEFEKPDELDVLKSRAMRMGIRHSPNIGVDALRKKLDQALNDEAVVAGEDEDGEKVKVSENERKAALRRKLKRDKMRLVRVRISNLNPSKKELHGEIFTVANKYLGIVKKFIPYGEATEEGYHIPYVLYRQLQTRRFLQVRVRENKQTGKTDISQRWVPEFALEELPPLTEAELSKLANAQRAAGSVG